jgi:hypothetical protein
MSGQADGKMPNILSTNCATNWPEILEMRPGVSVVAPKTRMRSRFAAQRVLVLPGEPMNEILHLNLHREFFDAIACKRKRMARIYED